MKNKSKTISLFIFFICVFASNTLFAQSTFQLSYGDKTGEIPMTLIQTSDKGFAMLGVTNNSNHYPYLVKTDSAGNKQWSEAYNISNFLNVSSQFDVNGAIIQTWDKGFLLCGGNILLKVDKIGNVTWAKKFGVNYSKIIATSGGYVLSSANAPAFTKIDTSGHILWTSDNPGTNAIFDIVQSKFDSCYYVLYDNALIGKLDKQGVGIWSKTIQMSSTCNCYFYGGNYAQLAVNPNNGTIGLLVNFNVLATSYEDPYESWTSFDSNGNALNSFMFATGLSASQGGAYYPASWMYSSNGNDMIFTNYLLPITTSGNLVEFMSDANGNVKWSEIIGGPKTNYSPCIIHTDDKGIATFCSTQNYGVNGSVNNYYLLKTDSTGKGICNTNNYSVTTSSETISFVSSGSTFSKFSNTTDSVANVIAIPVTDTSNNACICQPPKAGFYCYNEDNFQDISSYATKWIWSFGDSTHDSTEVNPTHTYADTGFYTVCLTVINSCGSDSVCHIIDFAYFPAGINSIADNITVTIFPNPSNGIFNFRLGNINQKGEIKIYNMLGKKVYNEPLRQAQSDIRIDISNEPSGIYLYRIIAEDGSAVSGKLLIQ